MTETGFWLRRRFVIATFSAVAVCGFDKAFAKSKTPDTAADLAAIQIEKLFVETSSSDSNFTVVDSRFDENAAGGAFFGVLGAGVISGINAGEDDKKADVFRAGAASIDLAGILTKSATETLAARAAPPVAPSNAEASHTLLIEIRNWGLIRTSRENSYMRVFVNLTWKIVSADGAVLFEKKRENFVAPTLRRLFEYDDAILKSEVEELCEKAGRQIANQIIYR